MGMRGHAARVRVLHTSDLHGKYKRLLAFDEPFDVWVDTGDFFDNEGRKPKTDYRINPLIETQYQAKWWRWKNLGERISAWLDGRPAITVSGNHDFLRLASLLRRDHSETYEVTPSGVDVLGLRWSGFREVTQSIGEWMGETPEAGLLQLAEQTVASNPDVVLTHARPSGVFETDWLTHLGLPGLVGTSTARWHFFGHEHASGGRVLDRDGVRYVNGACHLQVHELEL